MADLMNKVIVENILMGKVSGKADEMVEKEIQELLGKGYELQVMGCSYGSTEKNPDGEHVCTVMLTPAEEGGKPGKTGAKKVKYKKFQEYFIDQYNCKRVKNKLLCDIDGEIMKISNNVRQLKYDPEKTQQMEQFVREHHQVNKRAGLDYRKEWEEA